MLFSIAGFFVVCGDPVDLPMVPSALPPEIRSEHAVYDRRSGRRRTRAARRSRGPDGGGGSELKRALQGDDVIVQFTARKSLTHQPVSTHRGSHSLASLSRDIVQAVVMHRY